jgi:hypothetical protein
MDYELMKREIDIKMRAVIEQAKDKKLTATDATAQIEALRAEKKDIEQRQALAAAPVTTREKESGWQDIRSALLEKRAVTQNGAGAVNVVNDIVAAFVDRNKTGSLISKYMGPSASSVVPVLNPTLALPAGAAEGATGTGVDSTAVLGAKTLVLKPYLSSLAVSTMALVSTPIDKKLSEIFAQAYAGAIDRQVLIGSGSGNDGLGVFIANAAGVPVAQDINVASAGNPKISDLRKLAGAVLSSTDTLTSAAIFMHHDIYSGIMADATAGQDPFKYELMQMKVMGVPIILSTYCPKILTAGSYVAVGGDFSKYAMAYAAELSIKAIDVVGTDNVTFQALQYMQFSPVLGTYFHRLKTV